MEIFNDFYSDNIREQIEKNKKELKRLEQQEKVKKEKEKANINQAMSILSSNAQTTEVIFILLFI